MNRLFSCWVGVTLGFLCFLGLTQHGRLSGTPPQGQFSSPDTINTSGPDANTPLPAPGQADRSISRYHGRLLEIARSYEDYGQPEKTNQAARTVRLTNVVCRFTPTGYVRGLVAADHSVRLSSSADSSTHGKKLFFLFAKYPLSQVAMGDFPREVPVTTHPVGQVVVKEAWVPEIVKDNVSRKPFWRKARPPREDETRTEGPEWSLYVEQNGRLYHAAEKAGLFILFKLDPQTPDTDNGWVYGTVTPDGKTVTSAGRLKSCMDCHQRALHDRIFSPPSG